MLNLGLKNNLVLAKAVSPLFLNGFSGFFCKSLSLLGFLSFCHLTSKCIKVYKSVLPKNHYRYDLL